MKFKFARRETLDEWQRRQIREKGDWYLWFAWIPVKCEDDWWRWLETVETRARWALPVSTEYNYVEWVYREVDTTYDR